MPSNNKNAKAQFDLLHFSHDYTPPALELINAELIQALNSDTLDSDTLLNLINDRDLQVSNYLIELENNAELQKNFAESELKVNNELLSICHVLLADSEKELVNIVRGRKAVKKYK